jgi:hypothetical protein
VSPEVRLRLNESVSRAAGREPIEWLGSPGPGRTFLSAAGGCWLTGLVFLALGCFGLFAIFNQRGQLAALRDPISVIFSLVCGAAVLSGMWRGLANLVSPFRMAARARRQCVAATNTRLIVATDEAGEVTTRTIMMRGIASIRHGVNQSVSLKLVERIVDYDAMVPERLILSGLPDAAALVAHLQRQAAGEIGGADNAASRRAGVDAGLQRSPFGRAVGVSDKERHRRLVIAAQGASRGGLLWHGRQDRSRTMRHYLSPRFVFVMVAGLVTALALFAMIALTFRSAEAWLNPQWLMVVCCAITLGGLVKEVVRLFAGARSGGTTLFAAGGQDLIIARDNGATATATTIPRNCILSVTHSVHARDNTGTLIIACESTKPRIAICGVRKSAELYDVLVAPSRVAQSSRSIKL